MSRDFVYLASGSPRRRELLAQIGVAFQVLKVEVDESIEPGEGAFAYVARLARAKAQAGSAKAREEAPGIAADAAVLGADTAVVVDGAILGKPTDEEHGARMLQLLSGRCHEVVTAIAVATPGGVSSRVSTSEVTFRVIAAAEARAYWRSAEPRDKAGGYAIQGYDAVFVASLKGSYSGVMGLPLFETAELLQAAGVVRRFEPRTGQS